MKIVDVKFLTSVLNHRLGLATLSPYQMRLTFDTIFRFDIQLKSFHCIEGKERATVVGRELERKKFDRILLLQGN